MNACEKMLETMSAAVDGQASEAELRELEQHLAACPACRSDYAALRATVKAVRELPPAPAPADLAQRVRQRLERKKTPILAWYVFNRPPARVALAAALVLVVCMLSFVIRPDSTPTGGSAPRRVTPPVEVQPPAAKEEAAPAPEPAAAPAAPSADDAAATPPAASTAQPEAPLATAPAAPRAPQKTAPEPASQESARVRESVQAKALTEPLPAAGAPSGRADGRVWSERPTAAKPGLHVGDGEEKSVRRQVEREERAIAAVPEQAQSAPQDVTSSRARVYSKRQDAKDVPVAPAEADRATTRGAGREAMAAGAATVQAPNVVIVVRGAAPEAVASVLWYFSHTAVAAGKQPALEEAVAPASAENVKRDSTVVRPDERLFLLNVRADSVAALLKALQGIEHATVQAPETPDLPDGSGWATIAIQVSP